MLQKPYIGSPSALKLLALMLLSLVLNTPVQALPRGIDDVTSVEGISEYRLKNGLSVLLFPDQSKETVTVNVTYKVGSKHEKYGETGMAHLLEHLMFKGSKRHKNVPEELSQHGANANGTTSVDRTNYYETFAATEDNIDWALSLEADRMVNSFIDRKDLDSEMTVVRNEFERAENSPFRVMMQRMMSAAYVWHNNGKPSIGARADIENVSIERLQAFYKLYYQPDNAVLTVAGKFDQERLLKKIAKAFGKIPKPKRLLPHLYTTEPAQDGEKLVVVRRVGDVQLLGAAYHIPAGSHADYAAIEVLTQILGDTPRGRMHKHLVENKLAVSTFAFPFETQDPGLFFVMAQLPKDADMDKVRPDFLAVIEGFAEHPVTDVEVVRAKANIAKEIDLVFNSSEQIATKLSEYIGMGDWRLLFLTRDRIDAVTKEDIQRVAQAYLVRNNRTEGRFYPSEGPERVDIPVDDNIAAMLEGYVGRESLAQGEAFDPSYENIQQRSQIHTLPSGAKVALLAKKTRGESVVLQFSMQLGTLDSLRGRGTLAETVGDMLIRGTRTLDRTQLNDRLDQLKASMEVWGEANSANGRVETTRENVMPVIELLADVLQFPSFPQQEFEQLVASQIAGLEASRQVPQGIVTRELRRFFAPYGEKHPYYVQSVDERIAAFKALKNDQLAPFHKSFYGANHLQIAVVGDFDEEKVTETLQHRFGQWQADQPYQRIPRPYKPLVAKDKKIDTPEKDNAAMVAMLAIPVGKQDADSAALELGGYIFGGGFLNSRLAERLRQKDGLSYSVSAWVSLSELESRGEFGVFAIFAPQNRAAVEAGIREEFDRLVAEGIQPEELAIAKSGILQNARVARTENGNLAEKWISSLYLNRDMTWYQQREEVFESLTVEQVNQALKKYFHSKSLAFVVAADLSKSSGKSGK